jgi:hypothetical protein
LRKIEIIMGNGFSIDFINYLEKKDLVNLRNLFDHGSNVIWPVDKTRGFLSFKHCPYLWNLGVRQGIADDQANTILEDIITCANVFAYGTSSVGKIATTNDKNLYIFAYKELIEYLKHLFIYYNNQVEDNDFISRNINEWIWSKYFLDLYSNSEIYEVNIITYNYDIWLERVLQILKIDFNVLPFENYRPHTKFNIYKPHGSISFCHKIKNDLDSYSIKYNYELTNGNSEDFSIGYKDLEQNYLITPIIPPAGESSRYNQYWSKEIRNQIIETTKKLTNEDELIICGISYWHVDRMEIDELLTNVQENINVSVINPFMGSTFNAVMTSLFSRP